MKEDEIFAEALEIPDSAQRAKFLDRICQGDEKLRQSVVELLSLHDTADGFLDSPPFVQVEPEPSEQADAIIGRYRLIQRIGEGGFGDVWEAEQREPVHRRVALKIIKPGMDTRRVVARFESERQMLAMMNHPNIASIFDSGTTESGRPFFAMELVDGQPIDEYCDSYQMSIKDRLKLFAQMCRAVHHAHQKGIVHRDLKPSNILVATVDEQPQIKIIDFGISKALQPADGIELSITGTEQLMGTPEFMSPEQINGIADIDTRADVYALGGILYRMLTGISPMASITHEGMGLSDLSRAIREDDAPRPSTLVMKLENTVEIARLRVCQPSNLRKQLRGDLDTIVLKSLEKNRERRYESAVGLANDIDCHLSNEPIAAAAPDFSYRTGKFIRRHRVSVFAATVVILAVSTVAIMATTNLIRLQREQENTFAEWQRAEKEKIQAQRERKTAEQERKRASDEAERAVKFANVLEKLISSASPENGLPADTTMREQLGRFAETLDTDLAGHPEIESRVQRMIGRLYLTLREWSKAGPHLERALTLREQEFGPDHSLTLQSRVEWATWLHSQSRFDDSDRQLQIVLPTLRQSAPTAELLEALRLAASIARFRGDRQESGRLFQESWDRCHELYGDNHPATLATQARAGFYSLTQRNFAEARLLTEDAVNRLKEHLPAGHVEIASAQHQLARVMFRQRELENAENLMRQVIEAHKRAIGKDSSFVVNDMVTLARVCSARGREDEALEIARDALARTEKNIPEVEASRLGIYSLLASLTSRSNPQEAVEMRIREVETKRRLTPGHNSLVPDLCQIGFLLRRTKKFDDAEKYYREAIAICEKTKDHRMDVTRPLHELGDMMLESERWEDAANHLRRAATTTETPDPVLLIDYCQALLAQDDTTDITENLAPMISRLDTLDGEVVSEVTKCQGQMAAGRFREASATLQDSLLTSIRETRNSRLRVRVSCLLATCQCELEKFKVAERTLLQTFNIARRPSFRNTDRHRVIRQIIKLYEDTNQSGKAREWLAQLTSVKSEDIGGRSR